MKPFWYIDKFVYCEFIITFLCNKNCSYCFWRDNLVANAYTFKNRGPWLPKNILSKGLCSILEKLNILKYADGFKNYPLDVWERLFTEIFKKKIVYISFTGGEPLLHYKKITKLLETIAKVADDYLVRFDTNGSIIPEFPKEIAEKITYNVSYHKWQIDKDTFLSNLNKISKQGKIYMINRVVIDENEMAEAIEEIDFFDSYGFFMNINPAFFNIKTWKKENIDLLKSVTCPDDYQFKFKGTKGMRCKYPIFGFQLLPNGYAWVPPCSGKTKNIIRNARLDNVLIKEEIKCPNSVCVCLHQYSYINERNAYSYNILKNFAEDHIAYRKGTLTK